jgi:DHA1 family multidrug resistance protein-like MFS transporter
MMKNKQLLYLFFCNFGIFFIGTGLLPILPLYVAKFGASDTEIGLYLGVTYFAIAGGTTLTGWLAERMPRRRLFIGAGALGIPAVALLGQATALWQVIVLTAIVWFLGGIGLTLTSIFTGLYSNKQVRGKSFGLMFLAFPASMLLSGLVVGWLIEWQGYAVMFVVISLAWAIYPLAAYLRPEDEALAQLSSSTKTTATSQVPLGKAFYGLLLVTFLLESAIYGSRLGMSLSMKTLEFSASAISSTSIVSGVVAILFGLVISSWSDRFGRKLFLAFGILGAAGGAMLLTVATQLWQFWLATALLYVGNTVNGSVIPAFGTDLLDANALSRGLSKLSAMTWIAGIVGFTVTGYVVDAWGSSALYTIAVAFALLAVTISGLLPTEPRKAKRVFESISTRFTTIARQRRWRQAVRRA